MITAVDAHAGGEPGRVIVGGVLDVPGATMFEKTAASREHADDLRKRCCASRAAIPRLICNLILPPTRPEADAGFVIMEQTEYPACRAATRSASPPSCSRRACCRCASRSPSCVLESPAGLIRVRAEVAQRQGQQRDVPERAGVRRPPRRCRSRCPHAGHGDRRRRLRRHVLRHRRRRAVRPAARRPTRAARSCASAR